MTSSIMIAHTPQGGGPTLCQPRDHGLLAGAGRGLRLPVTGLDERLRFGR